MADWKILADNSHVLARLGVGYRDDEARGVEPTDGDEAAGRRKMMLDMGLTSSELSAGLAGMDVRTWMKARAVESGMSWPDGNPRFQRELAYVLQENARSHGVGLAEYMLLEPSVVQSSMGKLYGSGMSGQEYLLSGLERDPMDWSGRTQKDVTLTQTSHEMFAGKVLAENQPSANLFDEDLPRTISWDDFEKDYGNDKRTLLEVGKENLPMPDLSNVPEIQFQQ